MATNPNIAMSYNPNVALQRRDPLADAVNMQSLQANQSKMEDLRELKELSTRLAAAGKNPDPLAMVSEMRSSGRPDMIAKSYELETNIKALGLEEQAYKALIKGVAPAGPSMPQAAPTAAPGSFAADVATRRGAMPINALAPIPAAPTNALTPAPAMEPQAQEINRLMGIATQFPTTKAGAQAMKNAELLQKMQPATSAEVQTMRALGIPLTPEGYQQLRNAQHQKRLLTNEELQQKLQIAKAGASSISMSTEKKFGEQLAGRVAERDDAKLGVAESAPRLAESANRIIEIVSRGDVFTGPIADVKLNIARALNVAGANNQERIANTELLIAATGQSTIDAIKSAGLGTGQGFTDKDLKFLQGVAGGTTNLTAQTLTELASLQHRVATSAADAWNKRSKEIPKGVLAGMGISTEPIKVPPLASVMKKPAASRPAGVGANWTLERDASGNTAWVSPDRKSFKEAQ